VAAAFDWATTRPTAALERAALPLAAQVEVRCPEGFVLDATDGFMGADGLSPDEVPPLSATPARIAHAVAVAGGRWMAQRAPGGGNGSKGPWGRQVLVVAEESFRPPSRTAVTECAAHPRRGCPRHALSKVVIRPAAPGPRHSQERPLRLRTKLCCDPSADGRGGGQARGESARGGGRADRARARRRRYALKAVPGVGLKFPRGAWPAGEQRPLKVTVLELKSSARAVKALGASRLAGRAVYLQPSGLAFDAPVEIKLPFSSSAAVGNDAPRPAPRAPRPAPRAPRPAPRAPRPACALRRAAGGGA
jgi:hypothetical protein